nr:hypothetical protein [uncultured archaeon]
MRCRNCGEPLEQMEPDQYLCSDCGLKFDSEGRYICWWCEERIDERLPYCPNCGAMAPCG